jgi:hypothetical protein
MTVGIAIALSNLLPHREGLSGEYAVPGLLVRVILEPPRPSSNAPLALPIGDEGRTSAWPPSPTRGVGSEPS